jgi:hypothetical protein
LNEVNKPKSAKKNILLGILIVSLVYELALTTVLFFAPQTAVELFKMSYNTETSFLGYIIGWFCLLASIIIYYAIYFLRDNNKISKTIVNIIGFWWILLGIGVYLKFGKLDNLILDSVKGAFLVCINYLYWKENKQ